MDLQFYAFFTIVLSGISLGLLFDLLRALRWYFRPNRWVGAAGDLLYWGAATVAMAAGLFMGNWGELRFYVLVGTLTGLALYYWLASPVILALVRGILRLMAWVLEVLWELIRRLVLAPIIAVATLLWGAGRVIWGWLRGLLGVLVAAAGAWLWRPLRRPYRCARLHYLLARRRLKRTLRHWLLGPPHHRRK